MANEEIKKEPTLEEQIDEKTAGRRLEDKAKKEKKKKKRQIYFKAFLAILSAISILRIPFMPSYITILTIIAIAECCVYLSKYEKKLLEEKNKAKNKMKAKATK